MTVGDPQSFNRYTYVNNDPMNLVDLTGLMLSDIGVYQTYNPECARLVGRAEDQGLKNWLSQRQQEQKGQGQEDQRPCAQTSPAPSVPALGGIEVRKTVIRGDTIETVALPQEFQNAANGEYLQEVELKLDGLAQTYADQKRPIPEGSAGEALARDMIDSARTGKPSTENTEKEVERSRGSEIEKAFHANSAYKAAFKNDMLAVANFHHLNNKYGLGLSKEWIMTMMIKIRSMASDKANEIYWSTPSR